ncbi:MAG: tRNA (guanosine(46)-N7)-methyltransferase TrmB [Muribaculaceae bacterium]|nr:tRNA (guanosine(46)-N7)-methyltransferase TrmB [Roseburia sp.]MCM1432007.1 tRNA (guanosine(46)-N7)-methyltransferase TrmB [Muribaculaceae bacterium]MCM1493739.1 tRNA (guanosine(46)-N7)-methyltransferase TrmB [Muribaculaceae bacterium]
MRLRNIPGADEAIAASPYCIKDASVHKESWHTFLGSESPIHMEIGMGKGRFLMEQAARHPDIHYIGVERYTSVLLRAVQKLEELQLSNVHFLCEDAACLPEIFGAGEVGRIYLNFSDPWPKARHSKRRLTSREFLERYDRFLAPEGRLEFKTDNQELFTFSLEELKESDRWHIDAFTRDLHHDPVLNRDNILTEYEEKFSAMNHPICKLLASRERKREVLT